ncbi:hypothetical protein [Microcella sp.]|uniref:hypothetical protein n=1 Tax=Microcella sp. TaxID=1913979 RepID=UPI003F71527D
MSSDNVIAASKFTVLCVAVNFGVVHIVNAHAARDGIPNELTSTTFIERCSFSACEGTALLPQIDPLPNRHVKAAFSG